MATNERTSTETTEPMAPPEDWIDLDPPDLDEAERSYDTPGFREVWGMLDSVSDLDPLIPLGPGGEVPDMPNFHMSGPSDIADDDGELPISLDQPSDEMLKMREVEPTGWRWYPDGPPSLQREAGLSLVRVGETPETIETPMPPGPRRPQADPTTRFTLPRKIGQRVGRWPVEPRRGIDLENDWPGSDPTRGNADRLPELAQGAAPDLVLANPVSDVDTWKSADLNRGRRLWGGGGQISPEHMALAWAAFGMCGGGSDRQAAILSVPGDKRGSGVHNGFDIAPVGSRILASPATGWLIRNKGQVYLLPPVANLAPLDDLRESAESWRTFEGVGLVFDHLNASTAVVRTESGGASWINKGDRIGLVTTGASYQGGRVAHAHISTAEFKNARVARVLNWATLAAIAGLSHE